MLKYRKTEVFVLLLGIKVSSLEKFLFKTSLIEPCGSFSQIYDLDILQVCFYAPKSPFSAIEHGHPNLSEQSRNCSAKNSEKTRFGIWSLVLVISNFNLSWGIIPFSLIGLGFSHVHSFGSLLVKLTDNSFTCLAKTASKKLSSTYSVKIEIGDDFHHNLWCFSLCLTRLALVYNLCLLFL